MSNFKPYQYKNSKACEVWILYLDTNQLELKWFGSVTLSNPGHFNYCEFTSDQSKTSTFSFGPFKSQCHPEQTIFESALTATTKKCGYFKFNNLENKLLTAPFICHDLEGNLTTNYSPYVEYECITFFVRIDNTYGDIANKCTKSTIKAYSQHFDDNNYEYFTSIEELFNYKRDIESLMFKEVEVEPLFQQVTNNILPIINVANTVRINPFGFPDANKREGTGLIINTVPLIPIAAKTLKNIRQIINELFDTDYWFELINSKINPILTQINTLESYCNKPNLINIYLPLKLELTQLLDRFRHLPLSNTELSKLYHITNSSFDLLINFCLILKQEDFESVPPLISQLVIVTLSKLNSFKSNDSMKRLMI